MIAEYSIMTLVQHTYRVMGSDEILYTSLTGVMMCAQGIWGMAKESGKQCNKLNSTKKGIAITGQRIHD